MGEAVRIRRRGSAVLNSKAEFNCCSIVRLTLPEAPQTTSQGDEEELVPTVEGESLVPHYQGAGKPSKFIAEKRGGDQCADKPSKRARTECLVEDWGLKVESSLCLGLHGLSSLCLVGGQSSLGLHLWQLAYLDLGEWLVGIHIAQPV